VIELPSQLIQLRVGKDGRSSLSGKFTFEFNRQSKMLHTDATKMPYLDASAPQRTLSGQMWVYFGDRAHPFNVFDFCRDHSAQGIDAFLQANDYHGYLNADALNVYDHLFASSAGCHAFAALRRPGTSTTALPWAAKACWPRPPIHGELN
jgi:hypothetical protein